MNDYRYILDKSSKKFICPNCKKKTFVRYIDLTTGNYAAEQYGRCDRESKCKHHVQPPPETLCYFVPIDGIKSISNAAFAISQKGKSITVPKLAVFEQNANGIYLAAYFLKDEKNRRKDTATIEYSHSEQKYFAENGSTAVVHTVLPKVEIKDPVYFDFETFKETLNPERYEKNTFIQNLLKKVQYPFDIADVTKVVQLYRLGTVANGYRAGAITFPFIDINDNVRAIQVKQFNEANNTTGTDFLHSIIEKHHAKNEQPLPDWLKGYKDNELKVSCLFGEHLLKRYPTNPIALVEAPKTAVYGTLYFGLPETPESLIWLAVYNKSSFSFDKLKVLQGRFVYVFPDLSKDGNTFQEWETKAEKYETRLPKTRFIFSDLLEKLAPERDKNSGNDIADFLIKLDWRLFRKQNIKEAPQPEPVSVETLTREKSEKSEAPNKTFFSQPKPLINNEKLANVNIQNLTKPNIEQPQNWSNEIAELENYFASIELPTQPVKLNKCSTIKDCTLFIESHLATVKVHNGNRTFLPYLNRLQEFKQTLTINSNAKVSYIPNPIQ